MNRLGGALCLSVAALGCARPAASGPCDCPAPVAAPTSEAGLATDPGSRERALASLLSERRSVRRLGSAPLARDDLGALVWAAQGVSAPSQATGRPDAQGLRVTPSAGALYPLELYVVVERVEGLPPGVYRYRPAEDELEAVGPSGHLGEELARLALGQGVVASAGATLVIAADVRRTARRYGARAERYVLMEAGHAAQNVLLMAAARRLGACPVGAFEADSVQALLEMNPRLAALYLIPIGTRAESI